jgi:hypothetical protein
MSDLGSDHESMAATLENTGAYRVLRRLVPRALAAPPINDSKIGILLDFETTGLDTAKDEVIELGMVKFSYSDRGKITAVIDTFSSFNQPSISIPSEVNTLTGITDEMVSGQHIDPDAVSSFASHSNIVIAHNANFDRKLLSEVGRFLSKNTGPVRRKKSNGANTDSTARDWLIYWPVRVFFMMRIGPLKIAKRCLRFWLDRCREQTQPPYQSC